ncbi:hypothetical protein [Sphingomonas sp. 3-13AW]|uniref:hypothetical protein n=1 Tax=Sphingomonas sp. 3-13AW TaxID=3050450 RepID=UPI003BB5E0D9
MIEIMMGVAIVLLLVIAPVVILGLVCSRDAGFEKLTLSTASTTSGIALLLLERIIRLGIDSASAVLGVIFVIGTGVTIWIRASLTEHSAPTRQGTARSPQALGPSIPAIAALRQTSPEPDLESIQDVVDI